MIPDNVTLIVKAPNQQIEDQNVDCQSSWTVAQLKGHLSEVYPSKPSTDEQKIIYSGQLLEDGTVLKDVLRTYESQIAHTMHLVCTPKRKMTEPVSHTETDGLRQRNVQNVQQQRTETSPPESPTERPAETVFRPETRQNNQNHNVEYQNYLNSIANNYGRVPPYPNYNFEERYLPVPNDPATLANQMLLMQQAYLQYMQQYANMWQTPAERAQPVPPPVPETPQPAPETPAPAPPPEDEEMMAGRDWLDHLYAIFRLAIMLSLVYLYGSPARLLLVLLLAAAGYLHQIGFFRDLHLNANNENAQRREQPNRPEGQTTNNANSPTTDNDNENQPSLLAVTWMIFTSFFASLIPDLNN